MNTLAELLNLIVTTLQNWPLCHSVQIVETHPFSNHQFALKIRAGLDQGNVLQVRLYRNGSHTDYAYHLVSSIPIRWDNKEHFPSLSSYPHHFHTASGRVDISPLTGDPIHDLPLVLDYVTQHLA